MKCAMPNCPNEKLEGQLNLLCPVHNIEVDALITLYESDLELVTILQVNKILAKRLLPMLPYVVD